MVSVCNIFYHKRRGMWLTFFCLIQQFLCRKRITVGTPPRVFRDTARQAVALLLFRDIVKRPRKGYFSVLFDGRTAFAVLLLLFMFRGTATTDPHPKEKVRQPFQGCGIPKGRVLWSPSQGRNSASSKEKFAYIKRSKANSQNTEQTKANASHKAANPKSRMQKKKQ